MKNELRELASVFRAALESAEGSRLPITLQDFPRGACADAALLLAVHTPPTMPLKRP